LPVGLNVVGDGPYRQQMMKSTADLPCVFCGYLKDDALAAAFASSDLFVFPSTTDTFGNVVLEAQASGLPVIVSDQGGPRENLQPEVTGLIVSGNDPHALAQAITRLVKQGDLRRRMAAAARRYAEQRSFEAAFLKTWEVYRTPIVKEASGAASHWAAA
ncbi:MAG: glycosyltransferase, partial [Desulfobacterales bacterium]